MNLLEETKHIEHSKHAIGTAQALLACRAGLRLGATDMQYILRVRVETAIGIYTTTSFCKATVSSAGCEKMKT